MTTPPHPTTFTLMNWHDVPEKQIRTAAFWKRHWVIHSPNSRSVWYATVLSNLTGTYIQSEPAGMEGVRATLLHGLSASAFERMKQVAGVTYEELARGINVSARTIARREYLQTDESERLLRVGSAFQKTLDVFGDLEKARHWFSTPKRALGDRTPLEYCNTEPGAQEVEHLLGRLEHGVFA